MKSLLKYVFWVAIAGGIFYGGYYAYDHWWNAGAVQKIFDQAAGIREKTSQQANQYAKIIASSTKSAASSLLKNAIGGFISGVGEKLYSVGLNFSGAPSSLSAPPQTQNLPGLLVGNIPAPTSSAFDVPPPPATIVVGLNTDLSLSINSGQVYKVDWGDGGENQGATESGNITVLRHRWASPGDYIVRVNIGNNVTSNVYSFPLRVYR